MGFNLGKRDVHTNLTAGWLYLTGSIWLQPGANARKTYLAFRGNGLNMPDQRPIIGANKAN